MKNLTSKRLKAFRLANLQCMFKLAEYRQKKGFTLAEVLITLMVIGIVASISIPSLMANIEKKKLHEKFRKAYATVSAAYSNLIQENGGSGLGVSLVDMRNYLNYTKYCAPRSTECGYEASGDSPQFQGSFVLNDGTLIGLYHTHDTQNKLITSCATYSAMVCTHIYIDVNGPKPPNTYDVDRYLIYVTEKRIIPGGAPGTPATNSGARKVLQGID